MPRRIILLAIFALLILAAPTHADNSPAWTAWLHYGRHMTLIDSDGHTLRDLDLPIPEGYDSEIFDMRREIGISKDSHWAAYILPAWAYPQQTQLIIVDLITNQIVTKFSTDSGTPYISPPNTYMFDISGEWLTVAYAYNAAAKNDFHIRVLNVHTGEIAYAFDTTINALGLASDLSLLTPEIDQYQGAEVTFDLTLLDPDAGDPDIGSTERIIRRSFTWNMLTDEIQPSTIFPNFQADIFPATGEVLGAIYNPLFPTDIFDEGNPLKNTLQVYDPIQSSIFPFYHADGIFPRQAFFVQNGTRILAYLFHSDDVTGYWTLLERDGTVIDQWALPENLQINEIKNTPNGFIYTASLKTDEREWEQPIPAVYEADMLNNKLNPGRLIWQIPMNTFHTYVPYPNSYFDIAWVHSDTPVGPFKPWAQLADPVYAPTPQPSTATITPTSIPMPSPLFHIGQTVRVQTIDGEILNLRSAPTRKSDILVYIEDDTQLQLLEGPIEAEGFHWWRVHTPDGLEGWVVENDGEVQTILPE